MTSQQKWYLLLNYFNNKINFLFNCEIRFEVCVSVNLKCQVNTTKQYIRKYDRGLSHLLHTELHWLDVPERVLYI